MQIWKVIFVTALEETLDVLEMMTYTVRKYRRCALAPLQACVSLYWIAILIVTIFPDPHITWNRHH